MYVPCEEGITLNKDKEPRSVVISAEGEIDTKKLDGLVYHLDGLPKLETKAFLVPMLHQKYHK